MALPALLTVDVGNIRLLYLVFRQGAFQVVADDKARAVAVRQDDEALLLRQPPQKRQLLLVVEHGKATQCDHGGVHYLAEGVFVVAPLHHDDFLDLSHFRRAPSRTSSSFSSPAASMPFSLFIRRSSTWHIFTASAHQSAVVFFAADSRSLAG